MATGNFYRGTSLNQDSRFSNKDKKLMNSISWPEEFDKPVNIKKVDFSIIKHWITGRITEMLGFEDDVLINFAITELEGNQDSNPCPKKMSMFLTGFLGKNTQKFMKELWNLLLEAEISPKGIPVSLIDEKKDEMLHKKEQMQLQVSKLENIQKNLKAEPAKPSAFHSSGNSEKILREELLAPNNSKNEDTKLEKKEQQEKKDKRDDNEHRDNKGKNRHMAHKNTREREGTLVAEKHQRRKSDDKGSKKTKASRRKESYSSSEDWDNSSKDSRKKKSKKIIKKNRGRSSSSSDSSDDNRKKKEKRRASSSSDSSSSSSSASIRLKTKKVESNNRSRNNKEEEPQSKKEKNNRSRSRDKSKSQGKKNTKMADKDQKVNDRKKEEKKRKYASSSSSSDASSGSD